MRIRYQIVHRHGRRIICVEAPHNIFQLAKAVKRRARRRNPGKITWQPRST